MIIPSSFCFRSSLVVNQDVILRSTFCGLSVVLKMAIEEGFITKWGETGHMFVHDRVAEAAYSVIPVTERPALHWKIGMLLSRNATGAGGDNTEGDTSSNNCIDTNQSMGGSTSGRHTRSRKLWALVTTEEMDRFVERMLFTAVNQLNLGFVCIKTRQERQDLIRLNLKAGERARQSAAFVQAERYFLFGLGLLNDDEKWSHDNYSMTLRLYSNLAETKFCNGDFTQVEVYVEEVLSNAANLLDKLRVYAVRIKCFGAQSKIQDAIDSGLATLALLGEPFPSKVSTMTVLKDMLTTKSMLLGKSDDVLRGLPTMKNKIKDAAMKILCEMLSYTYMCRPSYVPLIAGRLMQITLKHGASKESAFAFSTHALIQSGVLDDYKGGHRFAGLALFLLERFEATEWYAHVYGVVFSCCVHWVEHSGSVVRPLLKAHRQGMASGDIEYACWCAYFACKHKFFCGTSLAMIEEEMRGYCQLMKDQNQESPLASLATYWQAVLNLRGRSENVFDLSGEAMDQEGVLKQAEAVENSFLLQCVYLHRLWLAYLLGDFELAALMAEKSRKVKDVSPGVYEVIEQAFYDGLTSIALAFASKSVKEGKKWTFLYKQSKAKLKKWSKVGRQNCLHKFLLLKAEGLSLEGQKGRVENKREEQITSLYQLAIVESRKQRYIQDTAIAYERLGEHYIRNGATTEADACLVRAYSLFKAWGATAKQIELERRFPFLARTDFHISGEFADFSQGLSERSITFGFHQHNLDHIVAIEQPIS